ncbi:hypothetical protein C6Y45_15845 [Alkalicoccus saliphilus]|jgi:hypothetical protein|uniref:Uncharacterized protein n=2 Tax=Alkalicoccus saliphilus TaxID=200989 RepID=A0A2T4U2J1_9BACI|nr:hypothetical protein C6Y45_15845 [Alkalicoccus saliphilus]
MFNRKKLTVKRKARRTRQWFEKVHVYPFPAEEGGEEYFLVDYIKARQVTGYAVISPGQEISKDALKAHQKLFLFYSLTSKIKEDGRMRAGINLDFFQAPLKLMGKEPAPALTEGYQTIETVLALQLKYRTAYENFQKHLAELESAKRPLTAADVQEAVETAAMLDVLQYEIIRTLSEKSALLDNWVEQMKTEKLWERLNKSQQVFYIQLLKNEELMKEESRRMTVVKNDNPDKMLQLNTDKMKTYKRKEQIEQEKALRQP